MINSKNGGTNNEQKPKDVAVYLDFENLYVSLKTTVNMDPDFDLLMEKCREFGRVTLARAYADWSEFTRILTSQMFANGFEPVYVPTRKYYDAKTRAEARKNSVDIHITIDIIKSVFMHENIDVFILISGDRDYVPLINQIRQAGKSVYALGVAGCTSGELSSAVDEMFFYHQLLETGDEKSEEVDVYNQLMRAIRIARRRGYPTTLGILKPIMRELVEGFNERNYKNPRGAPFQKFKDLIQEAQRRRLVRLVTSGSTSEVYLFAEDANANASSGPRRDEPARGSRAPAREGSGPRSRERVTGEGGGSRRRRRTGERRPRTTDTLEAVVSVADGEEGAAEETSHATRMDTGPGDDMGEATMRVTTDDYPDDGAANDSYAVPLEEAEEPSREFHHSDPVAVTLEPEPSAYEPEPSAGGFTLDDGIWEIVHASVMSFGARPPSPRKLLTELNKARDDGRFGNRDPSEADLQDLIHQCVANGRLLRVRRGFSTVYRLPEAP